jgi:hypothetical protein
LPLAPPRRRERATSLDPSEDFMRMLRLSGLDADAMTDDQRDAFINMAENLGLDAGDAEDMVDLYLEEIDAKGGAASAAFKNRCDGWAKVAVGPKVAVAPANAP